MHWVVEKLLAISAVATSLAACKQVCDRPVRNVTTTFDELGDTAPQVAAATYAELGLHDGSRTPSRAECVAACGRGVDSCSVFVHFRRDGDRPSSSEGTVTCQFAGERTCKDEFDPLNLSTCPFGCGRLPAFVETRVPRRLAYSDPVAQHFAEIALLEALSVSAFAQLARDLEGLGLGTFRSRIARAGRDERRHARQARAILRGLGGQPERTPRVPRRARALEEIALGNAVEGCVRETFGAAAATVHSRNARDPVLRGFFRSIAADELRHAALAWDVHAVLMDRLPRAARARVARAQQAALAELQNDHSTPPPSVCRRAGAPTRDERIALVAAMSTALPYGESA